MPSMIPARRSQSESLAFCCGTQVFGIRDRTLLALTKSCNRGRDWGYRGYRRDRAILRLELLGLPVGISNPEIAGRLPRVQVRTPSASTVWEKQEQLRVYTLHFGEEIIT